MLIFILYSWFVYGYSELLINESEWPKWSTNASQKEFVYLWKSAGTGAVTNEAIGFLFTAAIIEWRSVDLWINSDLQKKFIIECYARYKL